MPQFTEISSSTERLKDLRKLYFQYKSNAHILTNSPYFTNRQQQKNVVAYINSNKYDLDKRKIDEILAHFHPDPEALRTAEPLEMRTVKVRMMVLGHIIELEKEASNIGELEHQLKI
jgi:hypothetical protein